MTLLPGESPAERTERTGVLLAELRSLATRLNRVADTLVEELEEFGVELREDIDEHGERDVP